MNFEEFKKRYAQKLVSTGFFATVEDALADDGFNDRMAELYLGLMVYAEFQREQAQEQLKQQREQMKKKTSGIILPGGGH